MLRNYLKKATNTLSVHLCYPVVKKLVSPVIRGIWINRVEGLENLPQDGACIIASNHESYLDFISFIAICPRQIHYLAAEKFFTHPVWKWVMLIMGQIKIDRFADAKISSFRVVLSSLKKGKMIGIFPEGTRSSDGRLLRGKPGIAQLALKSKVPVVPVGIIGTYEVMSRHQSFPRFEKKITIRIGKPIDITQQFDEFTGKEKLQGITDQIMLKIADLTGEEYPFREESVIEAVPEPSACKVQSEADML